MAYDRAQGEMRPICFIRYNPDAFKVNGKKQGVSHEQRQARLYDFLVNLRCEKDFELQYMYYNTLKLDEHVVCEVWNHAEYDPILRQHCLPGICDSPDQS